MEKAGVRGPTLGALAWVILAAGWTAGCRQSPNPPAPTAPGAGVEVSRLIAQLDVPGARDSGSEMMFQTQSDKAAGKLAAIGEPAVTPLIEELHKPAGWRRTWAARVLGQIGYPRALEPLAELLPHGGSTRPAIIEALGEFRDARAVPLLGPLLAGEGRGGGERLGPREVGEGYWAGKALGEIGEAARPVLMDALRSPSHHARENALIGLAVHPAPGDAAIAKRYLHDPDARVREAAQALFESAPQR